MKRVDVDMVQKSLLCGFKGLNNFFIGAIVATNGAMMGSGPVGSRKRKEGLYGMYNNIVPSLEVLVCISAVCFGLERLLEKFCPSLDMKARVAIALSSCMLLMMLICTVLRVLEFRKDCCGDYDYKASFERHGGYGAHFKIPEGGNTEEEIETKRVNRNLLAKFLNVRAFHFDSWVSPDPILSEGSSQTEKDGVANEAAKVSRSPRVVAMNFLGSVLAWPFFAIMLAFNVIELPIVALIDLVALVSKEGRKHPFAGSRDVLCQGMLSFSQLIEPVMCLLPEKAQVAVAAKFLAAVRFIEVDRSSGDEGPAAGTGKKSSCCSHNPDQREVDRSSDDEGPAAGTGKKSSCCSHNPLSAVSHSSVSDVMPEATTQLD